ncbi:ceramide-1-phosphate transfer protein-like isoform X2 [Branchiostoma floridae]|uniref:Ceramide-1-phosphate transfer protein-like isoform X2 n=1 Tax=Branchiostoma floridae TaxID=7739 RepID=A0A9J7MBT5_BRAFL|nr:ceramide-1-phosphate transfer protein-like isoform X2 [Branchiostoma floridae]
MKRRLKMVILVTAVLCLFFLWFGLGSGRPSSRKTARWNMLQETADIIHSLGGKGHVHINNKQYNIEGRAIMQGGDQGSIKVEAGWHEVKKDSQHDIKQQEGLAGEDDNPKQCYLSPLVNSFKNVMTNNGEVNTTTYANSQSELMKLLEMLGTVFSFVTSDAKSKIEILEAYRASEQGKHYATIESMLQYEKDTGIVLDNKKPSGARTLLRLHRALKFIMEFLNRMGKSTSDAKVSTLAYECYHETLANYHVWIVRKAAGMAFYTLPTRKNFLEKLCKEEEDVVLGLVSELADTILPVYEQTEELYTKFDFHELP